VKITITSTKKIVELVINGASVPARIWQGETDSGVPVHCFITRIVPEVRKTDEHFQELTAQFERELERTEDPRLTVEAIPLRMIL